MVLGGWRAGWHSLCALLMVKYKPQVQSLSLSLTVAMVKIFVCVCWVTGFGGVGDVGLHKTNCVIKERTHTLSI